MAHRRTVRDEVFAEAHVDVRGFWCYSALIADAWLVPIRQRPDVTAIIDRARLRMERARELFDEAGGEAVLS